MSHGDDNLKKILRNANAPGDRLPAGFVDRLAREASTRERAMRRAPLLGGAGLAAAAAIVIAVAWVARIPSGPNRDRPDGTSLLAMLGVPTDPRAASAWINDDGELEVSAEALGAGGSAVSGTIEVRNGAGEEPLAAARFDARAGKPASASLRCDIPRGAQWRDLQVRLSLADGTGWTRPAGHLAYRPELSIWGQTDYIPEGPASIRIAGRFIRGLHARPADGVRVRAEVSGDALAAPVALFEGTADAQGRLTPRFAFPSLESGEYTLTIRADTQMGPCEASRAIRVGDPLVVRVASDKPLYQPGQTIHLRAQAVSAGSHRPAGAREVLWEIYDPKGNKLARRRATTSEFGVAAFDFALADEVSLGAYRVELTSGTQKATRALTVDRYVLPKMRLDLRAESDALALPGRVRLTLDAQYAFGKPVADAEVGVNVAIAAADGSSRPHATAQARTDAAGLCEMEIDLPSSPEGAWSRLDISATVLDAAHNRQAASATVPLISDRLLVVLAPESGALVPGVENLVRVVASYPSGAPARASVTLARGEERWTCLTTEDGIGEIRLTASAKWAEGGEPRTTHSPAPQPSDEGRAFPVEFHVAATASNGASLAEETRTIDLDTSPLLLRPSRVLTRAGEPLAISCLGVRGTIFVDLHRDGQVIASATLEAGQATLPIPADCSGTLELVAWRVGANGTVYGDSHLVLVEPAASLTIDLEARRDSGTALASGDAFLPAESGTLRFQVRHGREGVRAALGLLIVDEKIAALQPIDPSMEPLHWMLADRLREIPKPLAGGPVRALPESLDAQAKEPLTAEARERAAEVILSLSQSAASYGWAENAVRAQRDRTTETSRKAHEALTAGLDKALEGGLTVPALGAYDAERHTWAVDDSAWRLCDLAEEERLDPWGEPYTVRELAALGLPTMLDVRATRQSWIEMNRIASTLCRFSMEGNENGNVEWRQVDGRYIPEPTALRQHPHYSADEMRLDFGGDDPLADEEIRKLPSSALADAWGTPYRMHAADADIEGHPVWFLRRYRLLSAGPDLAFDTSDDLRWPDGWEAYRDLILSRNENGLHWQEDVLWAENARGVLFRSAEGDLMLDSEDAADFRDEMGMGRAMPTSVWSIGAKAPTSGLAEHERDERWPFSMGGAAGARHGGRAEGTVRVREKFPETFLWIPEAATKADGSVEIPVEWADSITTWRVDAFAIDAQGTMGTATHRLRVFQDFFIEIDAPVALTRNDQVWVPVSCYNYLDRAQRVTLSIEDDPARHGWFALEGSRRVALDLAPGAVSVAYFHITANRPGTHTLTVRAEGETMSDAVRRSVRVVPDGRAVENVSNGRLVDAPVRLSAEIPAGIVPGSTQVLLKFHPGAFSQLLEGAEALIGIPGG